MKYLPLLFALYLFSCEPETIEKIVYIRDSLKTVTYTAASFDSVRTFSQKIDTVYDFETIIKYDTILIQKDSFRVDTVTVIQQTTKIDTITVETIRVDTVERQAKLTYLPLFEPYVEKFFAYVDADMGRSGMLNVDVNIDTIYFSNRTLSFSDVRQGGWNIYVRYIPGCMEAGFYREMMHCLWGRDYAGEWYPPGDDPNIDHIMTQNWPFCLEDHSERQRLLEEIF